MIAEKKKSKLKVGNFIRYILDPADVSGKYGLVFRIHTPKEHYTSGQAVWFHERKHWKRYVYPKWRGSFTAYDISGVMYSQGKPDCEIVKCPPKRILKRIEKALLYVVDAESQYYEPGKFTNLELVEMLAKMKKLK